jgi:hypothetical protein
MSKKEEKKKKKIMMMMMIGDIFFKNLVIVSCAIFKKLGYDVLCNPYIHKCLICDFMVVFCAIHHCFMCYDFLYLLLIFPDLFGIFEKNLLKIYNTIRYDMMRILFWTRPIRVTIRYVKPYFY